MQFRYFFLTILLFLVSEDFGFAQQSTERKWTLPEGTIVHLGESINDIAYSPDGGLLAVASANDIWLYDTVTHQEVARLTGSTREIRSVAFSPEGQTLASGSWTSRSFDRTVHLWDVASGTLLRTPYTYPAQGINSVAFSPNGLILVTGGSSRVDFWDVVTGRDVNQFSFFRGIGSVSFSPDGRMLAIGFLNGEVSLYDVATGRVRRTFEGHTDAVNSVAFSPNGLILASGGWDQIVRLYNVITGELRQTLEGHTFDVKHVAFSPDGKVLASAGDQTVRLWSVITGRHLRTLYGHTGFVNSVSFSPEGKTLASAGSDRKILLWSVGWAPADLNRDDTVNIQDLVIVAGAIGHIGENEADVNGDGIVDIRDLVIVAGAFGED